MSRLKGPHRIWVLSSTYQQFQHALRQAHPDDQSKMVHVLDLRGVQLGPKNELWVLGYPADNQDQLEDQEFRVRMMKGDHPYQVWDRPVCRTCWETRQPWNFRRPNRGGEPDFRVRQCRDCEAAEQGVRNRARRPHLPDRDEEEGGDNDAYAEELARYLHRRKQRRA